MKIMAVDYGDAHTGLACCDRTQTLASPLGVIDERNFQTCVEKVAAAAVEYEVGEVVVGNPINMNGTYGPRSEKCRMFADMLQNFLEIPVVMWDERSTTVTAHNMMNDVNKRGKERKKVIDAVAAAVILQNYLDYKANLLAKEKAKKKRSNDEIDRLPDVLDIYREDYVFLLDKNGVFTHYTTADGRIYDVLYSGFTLNDASYFPL